MDRPTKLEWPQVRTTGTVRREAHEGRWIISLRVQKRLIASVHDASSNAAWSLSIVDEMRIIAAHVGANYLRISGQWAVRPVGGALRPTTDERTKLAFHRLGKLLPPSLAPKSLPPIPKKSADVVIDEVTPFPTPRPAWPWLP